VTPIQLCFLSLIPRNTHTKMDTLTPQEVTAGMSSARPRSSLLHTLPTLVLIPLPLPMSLPPPAALPALYNSSAKPPLTSTKSCSPSVRRRPSRPTTSPSSRAGWPDGWRVPRFVSVNTQETGIPWLTHVFCRSASARSSSRHGRVDRELSAQTTPPS
jgi:hypothetical protein